MVTANRIRLTGLLTRSPRLARASLLVAVFALAPPPATDAPLPRQPALVAKILTETDADLRTAITTWTPKTAPAPRELVLYALYEQRLYRMLARDTELSTAVLPALAPQLRATARDLL